MIASLAYVSAAQIFFYIDLAGLGPQLPSRHFRQGPQGIGCAVLAGKEGLVVCVCGCACVCVGVRVSLCVFLAVCTQKIKIARILNNIFEMILSIHALMYDLQSNKVSKSFKF